MESFSQKEIQNTIIHSGFTLFPSFRQIITLAYLLIIEIQGIYICIPINRNSNVSYLIGQIFLLVIIVYAWYSILSSTPGPMSAFFDEQFIKKNIEADLVDQIQPTICTQCQIQNIQKIYHCEHCNRCVYKQYFHSHWLNTCIARQNFTSFIAFMIFLFFYFLLLEIDHVQLYFDLNYQNNLNIIDFFCLNFTNSIIVTCMFIYAFLIFATLCSITVIYFFIMRINPTVAPYSCRPGCKRLQKKGGNDKILKRLRQSIRQSIFLINQQNQQEQPSNRDQFFQQIIDYSASLFKRKSIRKAQPSQRRQSKVSISKENPFPFKTDFFSSAKIFRKKQDSFQKARKRKQSALNQDITNMTADKWKKYMKSTFQKDSYIKRNSELSDALQEIQQNKQKQIEQEERQKRLNQNKNLVVIAKAYSSKRGSIIKDSGFKKGRFLSAFAHLIQDENKQNHDSDEHSKKIKFVKKLSKSINLGQIPQKDQRLQNN